MIKLKLKGMTWSHERGLNPLVAASEAFRKLEPDVEIEWDARSLSDFELYPLELLADKYDFIMIDHPHIGTAVAKQLLLPLNGLVEEAFLQDQEFHSTGLSYASYTYEGKQWALPVDAAAQVSAYRQDLLDQAGLQPARSWSDVLSIAKKLPKGQYIGLPLVPVHAYSTFFTLCAQLSNRAYWSEGIDLPMEVGEQALALMEGLMPYLHSESVHHDPIQMLDLMGTSNEIAYVPLIYGYSNYAREGFRPFVTSFGNIPSDSGVPSGSMIGGVGLAISSKCRYVDIAAKFAVMVASPSFQRTSFFLNDGQPGHREAWLDPEVNRMSGGFFERTLETLMHGSLRPRFHGYISFQEQAGNLIRYRLMSQTPERQTVIQTLNEMYMHIRREYQEAGR
ncbi:MULTISPECIES: ABC transporter substrate-binding protein [Paenibacillus]|uniref:ABC transporter substrate-binding protein n=2 Tax=Paenibacillus TaxID=44249 RepID=UPI00211AB0F9|nr:MULTISPECIES: extracellular solute-binding protein [unclassified Paenibacillus]